tara:strand:- start:190 stop:357 length:168 start_codon:yes stop_codon:yes gene_type:complete
LKDAQFLLEGMASIKGNTDRIQINVFLKEALKQYKNAARKTHFLFNVSFKRKNFK